MIFYNQVKEASGIGYITSNTDSKDGHISIVIHSATPENAKIARMLVEITIKEQLKYQMDFSRLQQMQENLFEVQVRNDILCVKFDTCYIQI